MDTTVPANEHGASVLFIADSTTLTRPDHPVLVVDLLDDDRRPFRCIPPELRGIDNNLNIANMDWAEFADAVDENGVFRGLLRVPRAPATAQRPHEDVLPRLPGYVQMGSGSTSG